MARHDVAVLRFESLLLAGLVLSGVMLPACAARIDDLQVVHSDARYRISMDVHLEVPAARAYAAFTDYARLPEINPAVKLIRIYQPNTADTLLYSEVRVCVALLCKTLRQTQRMSAQSAIDGGRLIADVVPIVDGIASGDLRFGHAEWLFSTDAHDPRTTHLRLTMELEPAFWVPPLIGPLLIEHSLRDEAIRTSAGIERLASTPSPSPPAIPAMQTAHRHE